MLTLNLYGFLTISCSRLINHCQCEAYQEETKLIIRNSYRQTCGQPRQTPKFLTHTIAYMSE